MFNHVKGFVIFLLFMITEQLLYKSLQEVAPYVDYNYWLKRSNAQLKDNTNQNLI